jgi:beta-glucosidase
VLTGALNPSGRLPVSLPRSVGQVPVFADTRSGGDRAMFFKNYIDSAVSPLFAFGHGLSYTHFDYSNMRVDSRSTTDPVTITADVTNTGDRDGVEVVQLYCRDEVASVARPVTQLLGFARVSLPAGRTRSVTFTVHPSRLAFYDAEMRFVVEPGAFTFKVGASSDDIKLERTVELAGPVASYAQRQVIATDVAVS